jgi:hypothetical protein
MRHSHFVRYNISINVKCRADVRVTHQLLLCRYRRASRIKPGSVAVPQRMRAKLPDAGFDGSLLENLLQR